MIKQRTREEKWNTITHACGVLFALVAFPFLLSNHSEENNVKLFGLAIYFLSFLLLFIASTSYHYTVNISRKKIWRKIDHISIYFMISGTYVPFMLEYLALGKAYIFLGIMYGIVVVGTVLKLFFTGKYEKASLFLYLFLGWMILFIAPSFFSAAPWSVIALVAGGGLAYSFGVFFYVKDEKKYYHAIWHIFVLVGSVLHFLGVFLL